MPQRFADALPEPPNTVCLGPILGHRAIFHEPRIQEPSHKAIDFFDIVLLNAAGGFDDHVEWGGGEGVAGVWNVLEDQLQGRVVKEFGCRQNFTQVPGRVWGTCWW